MNRLLILIFFTISAYVNANTLIEENDSIIRENPNIDMSDSIFKSDVKNDYSYINFNENKIIFNGADWSDFYNKLDTTALISIVHIGDSHIQADIATGYIRSNMQKQYGNAGRGLIIPYKLAKTNEPRDYAITSTSKWENIKAIKSILNNFNGFTGISISPIEDNFDLTVSSIIKTGSNLFNNVKIYHSGSFQINSISNNGNLIDAISNIRDQFTELCLDSVYSSITINMSSHGEVFIHGISLESDTNGVMYHTIGNNGATFETYNKINSFGKDIALLTPELIIVSLGANEAFGRLIPYHFYNAIDNLMKEIKISNPLANILLVTPMECQRKKYMRRKNRRRRRTFVVNEKIRTIRDEIIRYGENNNIAVYDWYSVAGGEGASKKWHTDKLLSNDRIHCTFAGYELQGKLFYDALCSGKNKTRLTNYD